MDNGYTRDIFDPACAMLDVIVYVLLGTLALPRYSVAGNITQGMTLDERTDANARRLVEHYAMRPIQGIKDIRQTTGMGLADAKYAWDQLVENHYDNGEYHKLCAKRAIDDGRLTDAKYYLDRALAR